MPKIEIKDLQPGDAIVFFNKYYKEGASIQTPISERYEYAGYENHIAMFSHLDDDGFPVVIHAVQSEDPGKPSGLIQSSLQQLLNKVDTFTLHNDETGEDETISRRYDVRFKIFRYTDKDLAEKALSLLGLWHEYTIPYDEKRLNAKIKLEDEGFEAKNFYDLASSKYETEGKFRALKYAVRRAECLTQSSLNGTGRGLTCSMAFVLAFQVAELDPYVATLGEVNKKLASGETKKYNSDKHAAYDKDKLPPTYVRYLEAIKNTPKPTRKHYVTSYNFLAAGFDIFNFTHQSFPVDAKCIGVAGIVHLFGELKSWKKMGTLELAARQPFTNEQKKAYRETRDEVQKRKDFKRFIFSIQGNLGTNISERLAEFADRLRIVGPENTSSTSAPSSPEKTNMIPPVQAKSDPHHKNKFHSRVAHHDPGLFKAARALIFDINETSPDKKEDFQEKPDVKPSSSSSAQ